MALISEHKYEIRGENRCYKVDGLANNVVDQDGIPVALQFLILKLLFYFIERGSQQLITYDELSTGVWKQQAASNEAISQAVRTLRGQLGAGFIETVRKQGFKFIGSVQRLGLDSKLPINAQIDSRPDDLISAAELYSTSWQIPPATWMGELVRIQLHQPRPGNLADTFYVEATLIAGPDEYPIDGQDRVAIVGLREVFLSIESDGCQSAMGTTFGNRFESETVRLRPGGVLFTAADSYLEGDLLRGEYIAIMEHTEIGASNERSVTVELKAGRRSFFLSTISTNTQEEQKPSNEKDAIINAYIDKIMEAKRSTGEVQKDARDRFILARAQMRKAVQT